jgi:hypothetical protein
LGPLRTRRARPRGLLLVGVPRPRQCEVTPLGLRTATTCSRRWRGEGIEFGEHDLLHALA